MVSIITHLIVAGVVVFVVLYGRKLVKEYYAHQLLLQQASEERKMRNVDIRERELKLDERQAELDELIHGAQSEIDSMTTAERADLERARLNREAAEQTAAAQVAAGLVQARIDEEARVIAARTEARVLDAHETAVRTVPRTALELMLETYQHFIDATGSNLTLEDWLGSDVEINRDGSVTY